ncbi:3091_t:CDS:1 [Entrophospora sp. SA101]|nr:263_t:CDS:1 [Entrophospora sp. SA101]CAJ0637191.1 3091_t:CDS:1 [Entrophospora sp. SA101]CAJ0846451.1 9679_t:CDS:1 [Entrophospora sp. SA101]CAJ0862232.1 13590_t:CDS:1 [Entrophospora sp. SA101]CAJ0898390.1 5075_t:CDS:1 [Entrophospora sp. SA101]
MSTQILTKKLQFGTEIGSHVNIDSVYKRILKSNKIHAISEPNSTNSQVIERALTPNGFISAFFQSYNYHQHLKLSPDDIWLVIALGVSQHINFNSEKYRYMFVEHEGKKEINVYVDGLLDFSSESIGGNWDRAVQLLTDATDSQVKEEVGIKRLLECNFTTTTPTTKTASNIVLLDTMKSYFSYRMSTRCGIPKITLTGTLEDWTKIQEKLVQLRKLNLDLDFWLNKLDPIIGEFVSTYKGEIHEDFWSRVLSYRSYGSGEPTLTGWITTFFPYTYDGRPLGATARLGDLPCGRVSVPFIGSFVEVGMDLKLQLVTGFIGYKQESANNNDGDAEVIVSPVISWAVAENNEE